MAKNSNETANGDLSRLTVIHGNDAHVPSHGQTHGHFVHANYQEVQYEVVLRHKPRHSVEAHGHIHGHIVHDEDRIGFKDDATGETKMYLSGQ